YSIDHNGLIYTQLVAQWHERGKQAVFAYQLDNGGVIHATQDHKFMTESGEMLPIQEIFERDLELKFVVQPSLAYR
ncbi:MAG: hypothetical protein ACRC2J_11735, partial [Microcoleaceae cyanobacterium]